MSTTLTLTIDRATGTAASRAHARRREYVSGATMGAVVVATPTDGMTAKGGTFGYDLSSSSSLCTTSGSVATCTLVFPLLAGTYSIAITTYDQGQTNATAASPPGNALSKDTEPETVTVGTANVFSAITLHGIVATFGFTGASTIGAVGGIASSATTAFSAMDADNKSIDAGANATSFANGPIPIIVTDANDTMGCSTSCTSVTNDVGTSSATTTDATISAASDETLTVAYSGNGGPGAGVQASTGGAQPTGPKPYAGQFVATGSKGSGAGLVVPLFAFTQNANVTLLAPAYIWAAQAAPPSGADSGGASYAAYFGTPGNQTCSSGALPVATVGNATYFPGYGAVFTVAEAAGGIVSSATCTLTISDGAPTPDMTTLLLTIQ